MKLLGVWLGAMAVFWLWFALSLYDLGFGFLSRGFHDDIMLVYGWTLGVEPESVPRHFAEAFALDGALVLAVIGFRRRDALSIGLAAAWSWLVNLPRRIESRTAGPARPGE